jgi:hypothetical protein
MIRCQSLRHLNRIVRPIPLMQKWPPGLVERLEKLAFSHCLSANAEKDTFMMLFWKIRYLDRVDKQFKYRNFRINTKALEPVARAAVELVVQNDSRNSGRDIRKYRHLFTEEAAEVGFAALADDDFCKGFCLPDYFEDETGTEISSDQMIQIVTGSSTARAIPSAARQHDIEFMLAEKAPIPLAEVSLSPDEVRLLGYFVRDLEEMQNSAFMKDGPGTLTTSGAVSTIKTAVTDDEIRSFVMIFRRLYMKGGSDPASFFKIVPIFTKALGEHPFPRWIAGMNNEYQNHLDSVASTIPHVQAGTCTFTTKRLIDVFLYTQYAHQPKEKCQRQFEACLADLGGKRDVLTWMFLTEMWKLALEIGNAGGQIAWWFKQYCNHHGVSPDLLKSLRNYHKGLGAAEKQEKRQRRLFREKVKQLATDLWEEAGLPAGGDSQFEVAASAKLTAMLNEQIG